MGAIGLVALISHEIIAIAYSVDRKGNAQENSKETSPLNLAVVLSVAVKQTGYSQLTQTHPSAEFSQILLHWLKLFRMVKVLCLCTQKREDYTA